MGRNKRKITYGIIIVNVVATCALLYLGYQEYQKNNKNLLEKEKIEEEYKVVMNDKSIGEDEIKDINEKIDNLNNIDEVTKKTKEEVFKLASELETKIRNKETNKKIAYLTFDDGPYYNTYKVLNILKQNRIKATFFTTNINGQYCYDNGSANCHNVYAAIAKDNHTIANHTYTHGWNRGLYTNANTFITAVKNQENLVKEKTGLITNIVRFPGGSGTPRSQVGQYGLNKMIEELRKNNYGWVDWTAQDGDGGSLSDTATAWRNFTGSINDNIEVVLFHDYSWITTSILPDVIKYLQNNNYIILPLFYESVMINK